MPPSKSKKQNEPETPTAPPVETVEAPAAPAQPEAPAAPPASRRRASAPPLAADPAWLAQRGLGDRHTALLGEYANALNAVKAAIEEGDYTKARDVYGTIQRLPRQADAIVLIARRATAPDREA